MRGGDSNGAEVTRPGHTLFEGVAPTIVLFAEVFFLGAQARVEVVHDEGFFVRGDGWRVDVGPEGH